ncbi:hypothetical protein KCP73_08585 [Salmonella enterica subsp. enterica]|nr:hypothetical protein KCP73_08585 [Salmonella enterica subsp. enterica]
MRFRERFSANCMVFGTSTCFRLLPQNGRFTITQVVLDEATLFNIAVDPGFQRRGWGVRCRHLTDEPENVSCNAMAEVRA